MSNITPTGPETEKAPVAAVEEMEWRLGTTIEGLPDAAAILTYED